MQLLIELPVKSLLRFRSVSKSWLALICSPKFIKSHMSLSAKNNMDYTNHRVMLWIPQPEFNIKDCSLKSLLYDESIIEESDLDYPMKRSSIYVFIEGSINGLICLVNGEKENFLWNPSIRKYKKLPDFEINSRKSEGFVYGLGYDEIYDDYKVVRMFTMIDRHDTQEVDIYSLKNDSWRRIDCPQNGARLISSGKFVNGKLHWATTAGLGFESGWNITSFDLADEKWRNVDRPCYGEQDGTLMLGVFESNLSAICSNPTNHVDVWYMKEYGEKQSWIKMFTINYTPDPVGYLFSQSFYLSKRGEFLLMLDDTLTIYNPNDNSLRFPKCPKFDCGLLAEIYIESLVCPLSQNEPRTQQE
ncbi:F-box/kelch-repeat protein At3g23880-like [Lycium ferocissimum]|uniref:F-box/kelch-repeat protein At3g23880-like n=1 Tax=Lycium ferocissimum TaxID=112874 RepID=UPI0028152C3E|nr:F-box/kelch-repeat protein At3g23880-like [Lycium ferocissimum]